MKFVSCSEMAAIEERAFARGVDQESLMLQAGKGIAQAIMRLAPHRRVAIAFIGKGNNGGDALVALKYLREKGWKIYLRRSHAIDALSPLARKQLSSLGKVEEWNTSIDHEPAVAIDGLLGIGAEGSLRSPLLERSEEINNLRSRGKALCFSVDIPSGISGDTGDVYHGAVIADVTMTIACPKLGLVTDGAINHVGRLEIIPLADLAGVDLSLDHLISPHTVDRSFLRVPYNRHKGESGRIGILAGSRGMLGAAHLCAQGALATGAGLVTLFCTERDYQIQAARLPAEVMVKPIENFENILFENIDCLVVGPGLQLERNKESEVARVIQNVDTSMILDAGAFNILSKYHLLENLSSRHILTPHPGEMKRLIGDFNGTRQEYAERFCKISSSTLLYKGARTIVTNRADAMAYNTTGTPGMASGGQGDTLSGVLAALRAQGVDVFNAAKAGAWLCGRASEIAAVELGSPLSLTASLTADFLPLALQELAEI